MTCKVECSKRYKENDEKDVGLVKEGKTEVLCKNRKIWPLID